MKTIFVLIVMAFTSEGEYVEGKTIAFDNMTACQASAAYIVNQNNTLYSVEAACFPTKLVETRDAKTD